MDARHSAGPVKGSPGDGAEAKDVQSKRGRPKEGKAGAAREKLRKTAREPRHRAQHVDLDRQCGVPLTDPDGKLTGAVCARSLTCKTHSMGAKRAVVGRTQLYDVLLMAYQKKNQLKSAEKGAGGAAAKARAAAARAAAGQPPESDDDDDSLKLPDSEEVTEVLRGAMYSMPQPLDRALVVPTRLRSQRTSLSEFLYKATSQIPPPPPAAATSPLAAVMASTQAIVGRCVVFERYTHAQSVRPSQTYTIERFPPRAHTVDQRAAAIATARANAARAGAGVPAAAPQSDARPAGA